MAVRDHDERWDELALGHVLGGLPAAAASEFRAHLAGCRQCRARVAELRSLDTEMAAAEREERAARRLRTQVEEPAADRREPPAPTPPDRARWQGLVLVGIVVAVVFALSLWNAHLRAENAALSDLAERQQDVLEALGGGSVVPVQTSEAITGVVAVDGDRVAYVLSGLPVLEQGEQLIVWLDGSDGPQPVRTHGAAAMEAGRLESTITAVDAERLLVTRETEARPSDPASPPVLEAALDAGASTG